MFALYKECPCSVRNMPSSTSSFVSQILMRPSYLNNCTVYFPRNEEKTHFPCILNFDYSANNFVT